MFETWENPDGSWRIVVEGAGLIATLVATFRVGKKEWNIVATYANPGSGCSNWFYPAIPRTNNWNDEKSWVGLEPFDTLTETVSFVLEMMDEK